jgi:hypothetical protein
MADAHHPASAALLDRRHRIVSRSRRRRFVGNQRRRAGDQPNVLFIISDDAGWADFGFNDQGNGQIPTPALDSIAARGRWFRAAYTAPVCSPSRARMFLGQHGQRTWLRPQRARRPGRRQQRRRRPHPRRHHHLRAHERRRLPRRLLRQVAPGHRARRRQRQHPHHPRQPPPRHGIDEFLGLTSGSRTYFIGQTNQLRPAHAPPDPRPRHQHRHRHQRREHLPRQRLHDRHPRRAKPPTTSPTAPPSPTPSSRSSPSPRRTARSRPPSSTSTSSTRTSRGSPATAAPTPR